MYLWPKHNIKNIKNEFAISEFDIKILFLHAAVLNWILLKWYMGKANLNLVYRNDSFRLTSVEEEAEPIFLAGTSQDFK